LNRNPGEMRGDYNVDPVIYDGYSCSNCRAKIFGKRKVGEIHVAQR
jgi:hypothetical protein